MSVKGTPGLSCHLTGVWDTCSRAEPAEAPTVAPAPLDPRSGGLQVNPAPKGSPV